MRTKTTSNETIKYPDGIAFIFSQMPVIIEGSQPYTDYTITLSVGADTITEERESDSKGALFLDIARMAQLVFPNAQVSLAPQDGFTTPFASATLVVKNHGQQALSDTIALQWGAMDYDQQGDYKTHYRLRYWSGYPWSMPIYTLAQEFSFWSDNTEIEGSIDIPVNTDGWAQVSKTWIDRMFSEFDTALNEGATIRVAQVPTAGSATADAHYTIVPTCVPQGDVVYLRWLTRKGDIGYYLLRVSSRTKTGSVHSQQSRAVIEPMSPNAQGVLPSSVWTDRQQAERIKAGVEQAAAEDFETLCDLIQSPQVEMYHRDGEWWEHVNIETQSLSRSSKTGKQLQRIEIELSTAPRRVVSSW